MSASDTNISSKPKARITLTSTTTPPTITSTRSGSRPGFCAALGVGLGGEGAEHVLGRGLGDAEVVDRSRSYSVSPCSIDATVADRAREADERRRVDDPVNARADVGEQVAHDRHRVRQLLGRRRVRVEELLGDAYAPMSSETRPVGASVPTTISVHPPPMSTTR